MSRSLILSFHSASKKYFRLNKQIQKSISRGEFWRYTKRKRSHLIHKIERLRRRLGELRTQLKFATAGAAAALLMTAGTATAQTSTSTSPLGPFNPNPLENPFPPPAFENNFYATVSYVDMDGDGDLDAVTSSELHRFTYYENQGNSTRALFTDLSPVFNTFADITVNGESFSPNRTRATFADVDDDGDMDMVVGQDDTDGPIEHLYFFRNDAGPNARPHFVEPGENNPIRDIVLEGYGWPLFADVDNDGDQDLLVAGQYTDTEADSEAWVQFFRNDKVGHAIDVDPVFTPVPPNENPFYVDGDIVTDYLAPAMADLDEDGDLDFIFSTGDGTIHYRRNDNGTFAEQTGPWTYNAATPGASTGNPFSNLLILTSNDYRGLAFGDLDGDGDMDLTVSIIYEGEIDQPNFIYVENEGHGVVKVNRDLNNPVNGAKFGDNGAIEVVDYDHDGDLDMVASGSSNNVNGSYGVGHVVIRNDDGEYHPLFLALDPFPGVTGPIGSMRVADTDGDGDLDAIVASDYTFALPLYFENQDGEFVQREGEDNPLKFIEDESLGAVDMDFTDVDGDNIPDMILGIEDQRLRLYKNTGTIGAPVFTEQPEWGTGFERSLYDNNHPKFIDLDNDGDMDIIVGKYHHIWYYENIGSATLPKYEENVDRRACCISGSPDRLSNPFTDISLPNGDGPTPALIDADGDGDKDLLFTDESGLATYYENQNPVPVVTQGRSNIEFLPGDFVILDPDIELTDPDNDNIAYIKIKIEPFVQGKETLDFDDVYPDITGSWDGDTGELTLTGTASVEDFQSALRSVEYENSFDEGNFERRAALRTANGRTITKTITFRALDADFTTAGNNPITYNITHSNDEPVVTPGTFNVTYINTPIELVPTIAITDDDDASLLSADVSFSPGTFKSGEDRLFIPAAPGSFTVTFNSSTGVLHVSGAATVADYQAVMRSIVYTNLLGAGATVSPRTLNIKVFDGENDSNTGQINLSLFSANVAPALAPASSAVSYTGGNLALNPAVVITDDGTTMVSANVMFVNGFVVGEDKLLFTDQNGITGTFDGPTGVLTLSGNATLAAYQVALRSVQYTNVATTKTGGTRTISFAVNDGAFNSNASTVDVSVTSAPTNTPPTITGTANTFWASGEVVINNNLVVTDASDTTLTVATVSIVSGYASSEDVLLFVDQNGITGGIFGSSAPGVLQLFGVSSVANYQAALRSVKYINVSSKPSTANREIAYSVYDGTSTTTLTGTIVVINKPPVIEVENKATTAGGNVALSISQILSDPDNNLDLTTLTITSEQGAQVSVSNGVVTIDYNSVQKFKGNDTLTITVCDMGGRCATTTLSIEVGADPYVYNGMSPNGDGINDWFQIDFLPPNTQVAIYNRWGEAIFETNDYDTSDPAKRFDGKNKNGTEVLSGSYFYKVKFPDGRVLTGSLLLNR